MTATGLVVEVLLDPAYRQSALLDDARRGLASRPKTISPVWFYDERGSMLFDEITRLPEYYLTRAERGLLKTHASEIASISAADTLVELGSGTSEKTRLLLDAMAAFGQLRHYSPLDVSEETLRASAAGLAIEYPGVAVHAIVGDFHSHLGKLPVQGRRLVAFLGSTIGNLSPDTRARFLADLHGGLQDGDSFLLGVDLVKDPAVMLAAYDDASGVTAEFNRNALLVLNQELGASFDPALFEHVALWDSERQWIQMRLRSTRDHAIEIAALEAVVSFKNGEDLVTEISAKFTRDGIVSELDRAGFSTEKCWESRGQFLLVLARWQS